MYSFILNDSSPLPKDLSTFFPGKTYGQLRIRKKEIKKLFEEAVSQSFIRSFFYISSQKELENLINAKREEFPNQRVIIVNSNLFFTCIEKFSLFLNKIALSEIDFTFGPKNNGFSGSWTKSLLFYQKTFLEPELAIECEEISEEYLHHVTDYWSLIQYSQKTYETRFFNRIDSTPYILLKSSADKEKIKKEFDYYRFIPDEIKYFFVTPFNYTERESDSSYEMEKLKIVDFSFQWINNTVNDSRFTKFLNKVLFFIDNRPEKGLVTNIDPHDHLQEIYINKVYSRISSLKKDQSFEKINSFLQNHTPFGGVDQIVSRYIDLITGYLFGKKKKQKYFLCVSHGDLCFSNILYDPTTDIIRFIDPKGAMRRDDIYLDSYYDISKLSHSILGDYDFINNGFFSFDFDKDMHATLKIENYQLTEENKAIFRSTIKNRNLDYTLMRLVEASLFISMTPLHLENISKVTAFLIRGAEILSEITTLCPELKQNTQSNIKC